MTDMLDEVVEFLFDGAVDPREVRDAISKMNDASEVHVPKTLRVLPKTKEERQKRQAQVGLASNIVGLAAGGVALASAAKDSRLAEGGKVAQAIYRTGKKLPDISPKTGKAGALAASGALGLQVANTGGDVVANRVLDREAKKKVHKAMGDLIAARKAGLLTTEQVISAADEIVEKSWNHPIQGSRRLMRSIQMGSAARKQQKVLRTYAPNIQAAQMPKGRKIALTTTAAVAGGGGYYTGKKQQEKKQTLGKSLTWEGEISKVDQDKRQVFGWCSISEVDGEKVKDLQGDYIPIEETEKTAYEYVIKSRKGGDMHSRVRKDWTLDEPLHVSDMIESFVSTPEKLVQMGLEPDALPKGWWVGFKVNDDRVWDKVKTGERLGFSIHGSGVRTPKDAL